MPDEKAQSNNQEKKRMGRPPGAKDKKPRKTDGLYGNKNSPKNGGYDFQQVDELPEGYNATAIDFQLSITPPGKPDSNDLEEMQKRFSHYLRMCQLYDKKVSNLAAYYAIGVSSSQVYEFVSEKGMRANPERGEFFQKVRAFCGVYRENLMADGKVNPVTGIFWQKNYDGLRDAQEHIVVPAQPLGELASSDQLANKYLDNAKIPDQLPASSEDAQSTNNE